MAVVAAVAAAFRIAHRLGYTDEDLAQLVSRPGRVLGVWTVRAWREPHRANMISATDFLRMVEVLDERVSRPMVELVTRAAGMVAVDLPEVGAGSDTLERAAMDVASESGQLVGAVSRATADGMVTGDERDEIGREALDVVRSAVWCGESARS